jgi:hypothetical protein
MGANFIIFLNLSLSTVRWVYSSELSRETQPIGYIEIHRKGFAVGLAHGITESQKSHKLPTMSWRPRKHTGVVPVQAGRPEHQGSHWCKSQSESKALRISTANI